jgi:thiol-disulfide isomerase/thioredoxin
MRKRCTMTVMRLVLAVLMIAALPAFCALAQEKAASQAAPSAMSLVALKKEYETASKTWSTDFDAAYQHAKKNAKDTVFRFDKPRPDADFSPRFLAIAAKNPEGSEAIRALMLTLQTSRGFTSGTALETRAKAIKILRDHHATKPQIIGFVRILTQYTDADSKALLALIIARNPDRKIQLAAYKEQITYREHIVMLADSFKSPERREGVDKAFIDDRIARAEKAKIELEGLRKTRRENYGDLYTDLSIGFPAPEIKSQTVDGNEASLSALRGKVVVLDIWATWCGPCRAMIPHEREMVERLKGKPFALVSISVDERKETLTEFLSKEKMRWTHWWNGSQTGIITDWDVQGYPTIYVLDSQGVIRHKDIRGDALERAVNALLAEKPGAVAAQASN